MENQVKPDNNMLWAILSTVFCCLPLGIVSIVYASKVNGLYTAGNYDEAKAAADKAKNWAMYGAICGIIIDVIYLVFSFAAASALS